MKDHIENLNPFEVLDVSKNLKDECIQRMATFDGEISERNVKKIRKMKLESFKVLYNTAISKFKKESILKLMTLALVTVDEFRDNLIDIIKIADFTELDLSSQKYIYIENYER